jgi:hypothetical protein
MSKIKSAPDKKAASYKKDHVVVAEYPKGLRKSWPRKKAKASRQHRHEVHQRLSGISDLGAAVDSEVAAIRRKTVKKWNGSSKSLAEHVSERLQHRQDTENTRSKRRLANQSGDCA